MAVISSGKFPDYRQASHGTHRRCSFLVNTSQIRKQYNFSLFRQNVDKEPERTPQEWLEYLIGLRKEGERKRAEKAQEKIDQQKKKREDLGVDVDLSTAKRCSICRNVWGGPGDKCDSCRKVDRTVPRHGEGEKGQGYSGAKGGFSRRVR